MASYIDQFIMFLVGAYAIAVGYGWLAPPGNAAPSQDWLRRFGRLFKIIGPLLLVCSVVLGVAQYARSG